MNPAMFQHDILWFDLLKNDSQFAIINTKIQFTSFKKYSLLLINIEILKKCVFFFLFSLSSQSMPSKYLFFALVICYYHFLYSNLFMHTYNTTILLYKTTK